MALEKVNLTSFQKKVLTITKRIPRGKLATYGLIAEILGDLKFSRAVGNALNKNPFPITIPCHRVIRSDGFVGGFSKGTEMKVKLLKEENIEINQKNHVDLKKYLIKKDELRIRRDEEAW